MVDLTTLSEHMEIVGSDGRHVGEIDHVLDNGEIQLTRRDSEAEAESGVGRGHHHFIPIIWVAEVDVNANRATLSRTRDEAEGDWRYGAPPERS